MFKSVQPRLLSFDAEWVPDPVAAEALYGVQPGGPAAMLDAFNRFWHEAGATPEAPRPFIKTMLCRVVSVCGVYREAARDGSVTHRLISMPSDPHDPARCTEAHIIENFLKAVGQRQPQLVGFNSVNADVPILVQRAVAHGLPGFGFGSRPEKPWEGVDYFSTASDFHVDLQQALGGRYQNTARLHEAATVCGIPGKVDVAGGQVWDLYLAGRLDKIVAYNEFDALTTHLLWARMAHFAGLLSTEAYAVEQQSVRELCEAEAASGARPHLARYLEEWERLQGIIGRGQ